MSLPLSTLGSCCGHNLNHHMGEGRNRYLLPCLVCTCPAFTPDEEKKMSVDDYVPRRCQAFHGQLGIQCEGESSRATTHIEDHYATVASGKVVRWGDLLAVSGEMAALLRTELPDVPVPVSERQVGGDHYRKYKIQPWDIWEEYDLDPWRAGALKYILRAGSKGPAVEDLQKAKHYIEKCIERAEERQ